MTNTNESDDQNSQRIAFTKLMVEKLQDELLEQVESFAENHPDCDPTAFPVAVGQAFVAQCLKTYGEDGFSAARQQGLAIANEMERAFRQEPESGGQRRTQ